MPCGKSWSGQSQNSIRCGRKSLNCQVILLAVIKHIKSHNANYSATMDYLLFQHDEKTGEILRNELGQNIFREEFFKDGLNCNPDTFDIECRRTNEKFKKNRKKSELKSHHYIISFDPADVTECRLTGKRAQELCLNFARKNFPGYQAVVVTHTDGGNHSGNIHTHIVINSVRKYAVERQDYMDKPNEEKAGYKHRSTKRFLDHLKKEVMEMCEGEGLHQIDLLSPAPEKLNEKEFRARNRLPPYSRPRKMNSGKLLKSVPRKRNPLRNSRRSCWKSPTFPFSCKEVDTAIFIPAGTGGSRKKHWGPITGKSTWNSALAGTGIRKLPI